MSFKKDSKVKIEIAKEEIKKRAFRISLEKKTYDQMIWLLAEADLKLSTAVGGKFDGKSSVIEINPSLISNPSENAIRELAKKIFAEHPSIQSLHWFLAERQIVLDKFTKK